MIDIQKDILEDFVQYIKSKFQEILQYSEGIEDVLSKFIVPSTLTLRENEYKEHHNKVFY